MNKVTSYKIDIFNVYRTQRPKSISIIYKELVEIHEKDRQPKRNLSKEYKQFQEKTQKGSPMH